ncbi:MAG TPA: ATP-binding protein [Gemmatimonadales bacterium]|jgi:two-component system sensor histidine kinase PilS (NtrC family)
MTATAAEGHLPPRRRVSNTGPLPPVTTLLRWLYTGRIAVAFSVFLAAALSWWRADLTQLLIASVSVTLAMIVTAVSFWHTHLSHHRVTNGFLYLQAIIDLALVTSWIHIGGPTSYFAALYILVIAMNAVLMPLANGLLVALLAGILYAADVVFGHPIELSAALLLQVLVYWLVAASTGYLASRVRIAGVAHDALSAELRRVRLEAGDILKNIKTGILTVGGDGRLVYANPTAEALLGLDIVSMRDQPVLELLDRIAPVLGDAVRRTTGEGRRVVRREGDAVVAGRIFPLGVSTTAVNDEAGAPPSVTAIFKDISDEKTLEALHLRTERLEAVAEIAASLAHEIKNPLASIRSAVEQLARSAPAGADERVLSGLVIRESDRLSRLLTEFLDFSRVRVTQSMPLDLVAVAEAGIRLARQHPDCNGSATIELKAETRPVSVEGDEDLLHRVVFNLVLNAVQAAPSNARVTVEVAAADPARLPSGLDIESPRLLRVSDRGPGVSPEILPRLFEPFATGRAGGTGLGLAIVQRAVDAHRGRIFPVESKPGAGTVFTIYFPARFTPEEVG